MKALRAAIVVLSCLGALTPIVAGAQGQTGGALENPQPASFQSGIGLLSGWSCQGPAISIAIDGNVPLGAPYGSSRADTAGLCGVGNINTGFGLLFNFNTLSPGAHSVQLFVNGQAQGSPTQFTVTVPAGEFLTGVDKQVTVTDFPAVGRTTILVWQQSQQNFAIKSVSQASAAEGMWTGTTSNNQMVRAIILDDGTYYVLYSRSGERTDAGVVQGSSSAANGQLISPNGLDFLIANAEETTGELIQATVNGSYVAGNSLQLTITESSGIRTLSASYDVRYQQPASLAAVSGAYSGVTGHIAGARSATFSLDANGNLSGHNDVCTFGGTITPHKSVNVFDLTVVRRTGGCIFGSGPVSGIMYYDEANRQVHGFAPYGSRSDQFYLIGTK